MKSTHRPYRTCDHHCYTGYEHDESLAGLLDCCGRYYAHRIGGSRRGQTNVMTWLAHNPDVTQKELSEGLNITPASLSEVLMKLERKGYVTRIKDENDRRFVRVRLTEKGEAELNKPAEDAIDPFAALSEEEQETLKLLLNKLLTDWETRYAGDRMSHAHRKSDQHDKHPGHYHKHTDYNDDHLTHARDHCKNHTDSENGHPEGRHGHIHR